MGPRLDNSASSSTQHERGRVSRQLHRHVSIPKPVSSYGHCHACSSPELSPGAYRPGPSHGAIPRLHQLWHWDGGRPPSRTALQRCLQHLHNTHILELAPSRAGSAPGWALQRHPALPPPIRPALCYLLRPSLLSAREDARWQQGCHFICPAADAELAQVPVQTAGTAFSTPSQDVHFHRNALGTIPGVKPISFYLLQRDDPRQWARGLPSPAAVFHPTPHRQALKAP